MTDSPQGSSEDDGPSQSEDDPDDVPFEPLVQDDKNGSASTRASEGAAGEEGLSDLLEENDDSPPESETNIHEGDDGREEENEEAENTDKEAEEGGEDTDGFLSTVRQGISGEGSLIEALSSDNDEESLLFSIIKEQLGEQATHDYDIDSNISIEKYKPPWDDQVIENALEYMSTEGGWGVTRDRPEYTREEILAEIDDPKHLLISVDDLLQQHFHELVDIIPEYDLEEERVKEDYADDHNLMTEIIFEDFADGVLIEGGSQILLNLAYEVGLSELELDFIKHAHAASAESVGLEDLVTTEVLVFISRPEADDRKSASPRDTVDFNVEPETPTQPDQAITKIDDPVSSEETTEAEARPESKSDTGHDSTENNDPSSAPEQQDKVTAEGDRDDASQTEINPAEDTDEETEITIDEQPNEQGDEDNGDEETPPQESEDGEGTLR